LLKFLTFTPPLQYIEQQTRHRIYCRISEKYTIWGHKFARNYVLSAHYIALILYRPDQGDIVGRDYTISSKFMPPYGVLLADSTIVVRATLQPTKNLFIGEIADAVQRAD
jgi:hypothetical protein